MIVGNNGPFTLGHVRTSIRSLTRHHKGDNTKGNWCQTVISWAMVISTLNLDPEIWLNSCVTLGKLTVSSSSNTWWQELHHLHHRYHTWISGIEKNSSKCKFPSDWRSKEVNHQRQSANSESKRKVHIVWVYYMATSPEYIEQQVRNISNLKRLHSYWD